MEQLMSEMESSVNEIKTSQKFLLKRLDQLIPSENKLHDCYCNHRTEELQKEISGLQTKFKDLESKVEEGDHKHFSLDGDVKGLQSRLELIEKTLISKQANDSKLHLTAFKAESTHAAATIKSECKGSGIRENEVSVSEDDTNSKARTVGVSNIDHDATGANLGFERHPERTNNLPHNVNGKVTKSNFMKHEQPKEAVIKQDVTLVNEWEDYWRSMAQNELDANRALFTRLEGVHSIILLDISESMSEGTAWSQARTFLTDYLKGLGEMSKLPGLRTEHVALVTFGHETKFQVRYTDRYSEIQELVDNIKLGGPSQMYGGVLYALAAAWCAQHQIEMLGNGVNVFTKIIAITDGKPTESELITGPDIADSRKVDETKAAILQEMENFRKSRIDMFIVPVGTTDISFLETMVTFSEGMLFSYKSGGRLAKRQYLSAQLLDPLGLMTDELTRGSDDDFSTADKEDMRNIQERAKLFMKRSRNWYNETNNKSLPPIGSRVRRGPDWMYQMQDSNGPGTLIGHADNGNQVWVEWDMDGHRNVYRYGFNGYDVLVVDEPRVLKSSQTMAVGCNVKPGKDWKSTCERKGHGVVIKLDRMKKKAQVRWYNGRRGDYSYGEGELQEIEIKTELRNKYSRSKDGNRSDVDDESANYASGSVDNFRIAKTIEQFASRPKKNKNKTTLIPL